MKRTCLAAFATLATLPLATPLWAQVDTVMRHVPAQADSLSDASIDYAHARALPLPDPRMATASALDEAQPPDASIWMRPPGYRAGARGTGEARPERLAPDAGTDAALSPPAAGGQQIPSSVPPDPARMRGHPFTTSRANALGDQTQRFWPFRPTGKLFFDVDGQTFYCSAALLNAGVVVTAAHCVARFGQHRFYSHWRFAPAYENGVAPYGVWSASAVYILASYYEGTDACTVPGIVCRDDIATIALAPQGGTYVGNRTGYLSWGYDGFGFNDRSRALITALGYSAAQDGGALMQRTDSQGQTARRFPHDTVIGSAMTDGSGGGPWVVNFGASAEQYPGSNVVVGVTSWRYTNAVLEQQGASPFTSENIVPLYEHACLTPMPAGGPSRC